MMMMMIMVRTRIRMIMRMVMRMRMRMRMMMMMIMMMMMTMMMMTMRRRRRIMSGPEPRTTLCTSLRSRNALQHFRKSNFQKITGKLPRPGVIPEAGPRLCASLCSRNACQHFTRATLYGHLREKCRGPAGAPWSSTGLYTYRKNPSVLFGERWKINV